MAGLRLLPSRQRMPSSSAEAALQSPNEGEVGLHVIWGEVESLDNNDSRSSGRSGSYTSGQNCSRNQAINSEKPKKLQNKRLVDRDIQFRTHVMSGSGGGSNSQTGSSGGSDSQPLSPGRTGSNVMQQHPKVLHGSYSAGNEKPLEHHALDGRLPDSAMEQASQQCSPKQNNPQNAGKTISHDREQDDGGDDNDSDGCEEITQPTPGMNQVIEATVSPEELAKITATVRRNEKGMPTSVGSEGHEDKCRACLFVFTAAGCQNGVVCTFCHFKHKRANRPRPCKGKRNRFRKLAARVEQLQGPEDSAARNASDGLPPKFAL